MEIRTSNQIINSFIKIIFLTVLIIATYLIIKPFILLIIWSVIVAISLYPLYERVINFFNGKRKSLVTTMFIAILLSIIIAPATYITNSIVNSSIGMINTINIEDVTLNIPNESMKSWPLIGEKVRTLIISTLNDLQGFIKNYSGQFKATISWFFELITSLMGSIILSLIALIIAGAFMSSAKKGYTTAVALANKLIEGKGEKIIGMCIGTIRNVVKGIILISVIQAVLAFIGFSMIGLSTAGILTVLVLICAIVQLPVSLIGIPVIIYVFSFADTTPAIIFAVYILAVSLVDNLLKPILLAKGLETPMIIILIGALGGMMFLGILGLFIGPVILAIMHKLYVNWVADDTTLTKFDS